MVGGGGDTIRLKASRGAQGALLQISCGAATPDLDLPGSSVDLPGKSHWLQEASFHFDHQHQTENQYHFNLSF